MGPHELIYKLAGRNGRVLEACTDSGSASRWQDFTCTALPFLSWERTELKDLRDRASRKDVLWMDASALSKNENDAAFRAFLSSEATDFVVVVSKDDSAITSLLNTLHGHGLYAKSITAISPSDEPACAVVVNKFDDTPETEKHCQALSELAIVRYLDVRDTTELAKLQKVLEENQKRLAQLKEVQTQSRQWQAKAEILTDRVHELADAIEEKNKAYTKLEKEASLAYRQMLAHQNRASQLRRSFSYRFGNLFARSARNPKDLVLLPFRVIRLAIAGALNRTRRMRRARIQASMQRAAPKVARAPNTLAEPAASVSPRFDEELQIYMRAPVADSDKGWMGAILHPLTASMLSSQPGLFTIHPNTWKQELANANVLVVDAYRQLANTAWQHMLAGSPLACPGHLLDALEYCRSAKIPTVLLLTCAADEYSQLTDMLPLFSHVIAPSHANLADVTRALTGQTVVLRSGWSAANGTDVINVSSRQRLSRALLSVHNGQVLVQDSETEEPRLLYSEMTAARIEDVFGRPLVLTANTDSALDLRTFELLSKGAVPFTPEAAAFKSTRGYRFGMTGAASSWKLADDEILCHEIALHNVVAASMLDSAARTIHVIGQLAGNGTPAIIQESMTALVALKDAAHIPMLVAAFERQRVLPHEIVVFPALAADAQELERSLVGKLPSGVLLEIAEAGESITEYLGQRTNNKNNDSWYAFVSSDCHYGNNYFAHISALSLSGIAPAFAHVDREHIDPATLTFNSTYSDSIARLFQEPLKEGALAPAPEFPLAPMQTDFQRLNPGS